MAFDPTGEHFAKELKKRGVEPSVVKRKRAAGLLTECEFRAYRVLQIVEETRDLAIFPQVHVLQLFDLDPDKLRELLPNGVPKSLNSPLSAPALNRISFELRQAWFAWRSIDFVLCTKTSLQIAYGIEIDDPSHLEPQRAQSDEIKNGIFRAINVPLIRITNAEIDSLFSCSLDKIQEDFTKLWKTRLSDEA